MTSRRRNRRWIARKKYWMAVRSVSREICRREGCNLRLYLLGELQKRGPHAMDGLLEQFPPDDRTSQRRARSSLSDYIRGLDQPHRGTWAAEQRRIAHTIVSDRKRGISRPASRMSARRRITFVARRTRARGCGGRGGGDPGGGDGNSDSDGDSDTDGDGADDGSPGYSAPRCGVSRG
jgi:hypothetical protein